MGVGGGWGCPYTCAHACARTHAHARTRTCGKHDNFMQMAAPLGEYPGIPYDVIRACMHVRVHMGGMHPLTNPHTHPPTPPPPRGGPPESFKIQ